MKKYFLLSGAFLFIFAAAFGVWKFEIYKKFPGLSERHPASAEAAEILKEDESLIAAQAEFEEDHGDGKHEPKHEAKHEAKKDSNHEAKHDSHGEKEFKVKLEKVKPAAKSTIVIADKSPVKHTVTKDETAWFLANVYYGKGQKFKVILAANGFSEPTELKEGKEIIIPNPKFHKGQSDFAAHYSKVWEKRAMDLKERNKSVEADKYLIKAPMPSSKVVLPTEKIRAKDKTPAFPFSEVNDPQRSPAQKAKDVLREAHGHEE